MIRPRKTLRRGEPTSAEKQAAREKLHDRTGGICELQCSPKCSGQRRLPLDGSVWERMHLCHFKAKRRHGWQESEATGQKHLAGCNECHIGWEHNGGKPCPPK